MNPLRFLYITGLENLKISEKIIEPIDIGKKIYISNNPIHITKLISREQIAYMGALEYNYLTDGRPFAYHLGSALTIEGSHFELINFLRDINALIHITWMMFDNAINFNMGFALGQDTPSIHSNSLNQQNTSAEGKKPEVILSIEYIKSISGLVGKNFNGAKEQSLPKHTILQKETGRINIANYHLHKARSSEDMGIKISLYCSFFECLFSTTTAELSHQLSERIAFFLNEDPEKRLETYKKLKKCYSARSKVVHGDSFATNSTAELKELSIFCDNIARSAYRTIYPNNELINILEDKNSSRLDNYMLDLVFGKTKPPKEILIKD